MGLYYVRPEDVPENLRDFYYPIEHLYDGYLKPMMQPKTQLREDGQSPLERRIREEDRGHAPKISIE
jgi:hypothetical protein